MVVKLVGKIDGQDVIFERREGDRWDATVPRNLTGVYIVELTAVDAAGNVAYCARYIVTIDLAALCVHLQPCPYRAELLRQNYYATLRTVRCRGV